MEVRNRIVYLPTGTGFGLHGRPTEEQAFYLAERAKGGAGLVFCANLMAHPTSIARGQFAAYDEDNVPIFKDIADAVHQHGAKILGQVPHSGRQQITAYSELPLWSLSPIPCPVYRETPHEMDHCDIQEVVEGFAKSAANLEAAGFDGVEIMGGHGYLLQQSMSPWANQRTDEYGGSLDNRLRLAFEAIEAIRRRVGPKFVLGVRLCGDELQPGGLTPDDMAKIAGRLEATGKIDYISVTFGTWRRYILDMSAPPGAIIYAVARIKGAVSLPVIASQRINDPILAEKILADGHADLIGMARALICDPELPSKAREGRLDDIRACVACLQECRQKPVAGTVKCTQNAAAGRERSLGIGSIKPAATRKRITVIGGGPAGMEAARVAALRGHEVTLYEKDTRLGGQVNIASRAPTRGEIENVVRYLSRQVEKLGVKLCLGEEATSQMVLQENPDAVVVATGSVPLLPPLDGADGLRIASVWDVLQEKVDVGQKVVVVDGGESFWQCCGTAEFLANAGKQVEIISRLYYIGMEIPAESIAGLYDRLFKAGVVLSPMTALKRAQGNTLICSHVVSGKEREITAVDTVVMAVGNRACDELYRSLKGNVSEVYAIGDCLAPRRIPEAIREGHMVGRRL